jgi:hypothetical protein
MDFIGIGFKPLNQFFAEVYPVRSCFPVQRFFAALAKQPIAVKIGVSLQPAAFQKAINPFLMSFVTTGLLANDHSGY